MVGEHYETLPAISWWKRSCSYINIIVILLVATFTGLGVYLGTSQSNEATTFPLTSPHVPSLPPATKTSSSPTISVSPTMTISSNPTIHTLLHPMDNYTDEHTLIYVNVHSLPPYDYIYGNAPPKLIFMNVSIVT